MQLSKRGHGEGGAGAWERGIDSDKGVNLLCLGVPVVAPIVDVQALGHCWKHTGNHTAIRRYFGYSFSPWRVLTCNHTATYFDQTAAVPLR